MRRLPTSSSRTGPPALGSCRTGAACAEAIARYQMVFPEAARLLNQAGYYLRERARYQEAEPLYRRALAIYERRWCRTTPIRPRA